MKYTIGIDLGGTNIVAGLVNEKGEIKEKIAAKTARAQAQCRTKICAFLFYALCVLLPNGRIIQQRRFCRCISGKQRGSKK